MQPVIDFFKNLPVKVCAHCGRKLDEQADCYTNECDHCVEHALQEK